MKKFGLFLISAIITTSLIACSDDDNNRGEATETLSGFYTINGGNKSSKIPASITAYDFSTNTSTAPLEDAFYAANGIELGDGAQQALICGDKMFIVMYTSNLLWVVEPETLKILGSIQPTGDAQSPRYLAYANGKVYCSMYTGYVSEIDPDSMTITRSIKVGPNPDELAVAGNTLVVANSDGQNSSAGYPDSSISIIDLSTFTQTELKDADLIYNPNTVASNGSDAFVVCQGNYKVPGTDGYIPGIVLKVSGKTLSDVTKVCEGSMIDVWGNNLYVINAPYYGDPSDRTYKIYDVTTGEEKGNIVKQVSGEDSEIMWPNGVFVDSSSGDVVMLSYYLNSETGKALTKEPCYANIYDASGNFLNRVECGVGARYVTFIHESK